jgi:hypothetical protein
MSFFSLIRGRLADRVIRVEVRLLFDPERASDIACGRSRRQVCGTLSRTALLASSSDSKMCGATPRFVSVSPSLACMKALVVKRVTP